MKEEETIKSNEEINKEIEDSMTKANLSLVEGIAEINRQKFAEATMLCDIVNGMNQQMYRYVIQGLIRQKIFTEDMLEKYDSMIKDIEDEGKEKEEQIDIHIKLEQITMTDSFQNMINNINGKFISYKFLLMLPSYFTNIRKDDVEYLQELLANIQVLSENKQELMKQFYKLDDIITENNHELSTYMQDLWHELPTREEEIEGKMSTIVDIGNVDTFDELMKEQEKVTSGIIDTLQLFELSRRAESELHISFEYSEEKQKLDIYVKRDLNFTNSYVDISERKVEQLKKEKEQLEKEIQELKEEKIEDTIEQLEDFKPNPIDKAIAFNDKLSNNLQKLENYKSVEIVKTGGTKKKSLQDKSIKVLVENGNITTTKVLEYFDKIVLQSIYSVIQKNQFFDVQMLKEQMSGNKHRHKTTLDDDIIESIDKLRTTLIQIEIPEELQETMKGKTMFDKVGIKENILQLKEFYVVKGGHKKSVYQFTSKSIYFDYAEAKGQLISKDVKLLQGGIVNSKKDSVMMIDYLSTRIKDMEHQKQKSKSNSYIEEIKFNTIWENIFTENDLKLTEKTIANKKSKYKNQIKTILKAYKKDKYIKDFEEYSEGIKIKI